MAVSTRTLMATMMKQSSNVNYVALTETIWRSVQAAVKVLEDARNAETLKSIYLANRAVKQR